MELDLGLLKDETYGQHARNTWESSRFRLHIYLNKKNLLHEEAHTSLPIRKMPLKSFVCFIGGLLYSITLKNWLWAPKCREWLVFQHPRCKKINNRYTDIYTDDLIDEIGNDKCVIIEKPYLWRHDTSKRYKVHHFEFLYIVSKLISFVTLFYSKYNLVSVNSMIRDIKIYIKNKLGQEIDEKYIFKKSIYTYYLSYLFMLKWLKPKKVLLVVSYGQEALVWAASTLHIPTIELQHGVITQEHLGYSVPINMTKKLFPDYLFLLGNYWKTITDSLPLPQERLIVFGYPYFEKMFTENNDVIKRENQIVVISQGTIGRELSMFAVKLASLTKGVYKIMYKLHPGEYGRAQILYTELYEAKERGLLEIIDTDTPELYTVLSQSRRQIGVYSTALFEGMALGCQTILVDLPGIEYMTHLIKSGYAQLVKTPEEIQYDKAEIAVNLREELFASDWRSNWHNFEQMNLQGR